MAQSLQHRKEDSMQAYNIIELNDRATATVADIWKRAGKDTSGSHYGNSSAFLNQVWKEVTRLKNLAMDAKKEAC